MFKRSSWVVISLVAGLFSVVMPAMGSNFTTGTQTARKFGTHEIVLSGNGAVSKPFDTVATVTFTPPSGPARAITVRAFYDGENTWRARVYVTETGTWQWSSSAVFDPLLNGNSGWFAAVDSILPGRVKPQPGNAKGWLTEDGRSFLSVSDTEWLLLSQDSQLIRNWQQLTQNDAARDINVLGPVAFLEDWGTGDIPNQGKNEAWPGEISMDYTRYDLTKFQSAENRLIWIFDNYPDIFISAMLFGTQGLDTWLGLQTSEQNSTMDYMIARWSAFPSLIWLVREDQDIPNSVTLAFNREIINYFSANEPWRHLISTERCQGGGCASFVQIHTTAGNSYDLAGLTSEASLGHRIRAVDGVGNLSTSYSDVASTMAQAATSGLVAAYAFNEGVGTTVADASGNNNIGILLNGPTWTMAGKYGNALAFDGVNDLVLISSSASLNLSTGMTLEAWVYPTASQSGWRTIIQRQVDAYLLHASNDEGALRPAGGGTFNSGLGYTGAPSALGVNTWSHVTLTWNGTTLQLYVNGTQVVSMSQGGTLQTAAGGAGAIQIGGNSPYGEYFIGRIDEVRIYNRALSAAEIQTDMSTTVVPTVVDTTRPSNPTGLTATAAGASQINVAWTASTDAGGSGLAGYRVERCQGALCKTFAQIATASANSYMDTGLTAGKTYRYRVRAVDGAGNLSTNYSNVASATTQVPDTTRPSKPTGLTATAAGASQINVAWTASTDAGGSGLAGYRVERCPGAGCTSFAQIATASANSYGDTGLTVGAGYSYRVRAVDGAGNLSTNYSNVASATTQVPDMTQPSDPTGLTATAAGASQINVAWTASTDAGGSGLAGYRVERCPGAGCTSFAQIATASANSYGDTGLTVGAGYSYRVRAVDGAGNLSTNYSNVASATTHVPDMTQPSDPTGLTATAAGASQINVAWTASTDAGGSGLAGYRVERCPGAGCTSFAQIATASANSYGDTGLTAGAGYSYRVRAVDGAGNLSTNYSNVASATTQTISTQSYGLEWPGDGAVRRMLYWHNPFPIYDATYIFKVYPRKKTSGLYRYYTMFFWGNDGTFIWDGGNANTYYGAHPYPVPAPGGPGQWEIAVNGGDYLTGTEVQWDRWYTQAFRAWRESPSITHHEFYWDWPDTSKVISRTYVDSAWANSNPPTPAIVIGQTPDLRGESWGGYPGWEEFNGIIRGIQIYSGLLSLADIQSEIAGPQSTTAGQNLMWYLNVDPRPNDVTDKKGIGVAHNPSWSGTTALEWTDQPSPPPDTTPPSIPTNPNATSVSSSQINFSWTASTDAGGSGLAGYRVERCPGAGCTSFAQIATASANSYGDTGLTAGASYSYRVRAVDGAGNLSTNYSNVASATTQVPDMTQPSDPTGLTATAAGASQINVAWTASTDAAGSGLAGYRVERCPGAGCTSFAQIATASANSYGERGERGDRHQCPSSLSPFPPSAFALP